MKSKSAICSALLLSITLALVFIACSEQYETIAPRINPKDEKGTNYAIYTTTSSLVSTSTSTTIGATSTTLGTSSTSTTTYVSTTTSTTVAPTTSTSTLSSTSTSTTTSSSTTTTTMPSGRLNDDMVLVPVAGKSLTMINAWDTNDTYVSTISYDYYIGKYEVTYNLWYEVSEWAKSNGYTFANEGIEGSSGGSGAPTSAGAEPVTTVNWRDVMVWCNAYSQKNGLTPCYTYSENIIKDSRDSNATACDVAVCDWNANGYRLPTEAEWEFAARYIDGTNWIDYNKCSGYTGDIVFTGSNNQITEWEPYIWYMYNSNNKTQDVGTKLGNTLGIYDMSGNVWEWNWDRYGSYPEDRQDYKGANSGSNRMFRGGSWGNIASGIRVGYRYNYSPGGEGYDFGFRLVRK